ncbi:MAG: complex I subunit 5 family protein [Anaerolineae bacterium]
MVLLPIALLVCGALLVRLVTRFITQRNEVLAGLTAMFYGLSLGSVLWLGSFVRQGHYPAWRPRASLLPALQWEPGAVLLAIVALFLGLLVALFSSQYMSQDRRRGDYYPLLLSLSIGLLGMLISVDLFTIFMFTLLSSATAYILVAFRRHTETAIEAGFKYAILGGLGAMLALAGIGYIYRETGSLNLPLALVPAGAWGRVGMGLMVTGYAIKAALFPAHSWLPDAHGRAPSSVSALLSGIVIPVNLYVLVKTGLGVGWSLQWLGWFLIVVAILNMAVGNSLALVQTFGKRLLGYSTVAQMGYIMLALGVGLAYQQVPVFAAGLFLIVAHALSKALAFLCKGVCHHYDDATSIEDLSGLSRRMPLIAGLFVLALAGLVGIPPLAGFTAKWGMLTAMIEQAKPLVWGLLFLFLCANLQSFVYYMRLIGIILRRTPEKQPLHVSRWMTWPMILLAAVVVLLGIFPGVVLGLAQQAGAFLLVWRPL